MTPEQIAEFQAEGDRRVGAYFDSRPEIWGTIRVGDGAENTTERFYPANIDGVIYQEKYRKMTKRQKMEKNAAIKAQLAGKPPKEKDWTKY